MFKQLEYINYLHVDDFSQIYDEEGYFFYDLAKYHRDKIIIDLPANTIIRDEYKAYTDYLTDKGFKIAYKGVCTNSMFGLPSSNIRCIIVGSKNGDNFLLHRLFEEKDEFVTPISLLYGKPLDKLKKEFNTNMKGKGFSSEQIDKAYNYAMSKFDKSLMLDYFDECCNLNDRRNIKFKDGSNTLKGLKKPKYLTDNSILPYRHIFMTNRDYIHYGAKRGFCTIREIARLNGVPDSWSIDMDKYSREEFIGNIHNMLSPYIIDKVWGRIY